jgi:hypothetical protein
MLLNRVQNVLDFMAGRHDCVSVCMLIVRLSSDLLSHESRKRQNASHTYVRKDWSVITKTAMYVG